MVMWGVIGWCGEEGGRIVGGGRMVSYGGELVIGQCGGVVGEVRWRRWCSRKKVDGDQMV